MESSEEEFNKKMIDLGLDWDYKRELGARAKIKPRLEKYNQAISMLQELIDEGTLAGLFIKYNKRDGFSCRKLFNVANILDKPF